MKNNIITVKNILISVINSNNKGYICISDIAKAKDGNTIAKDGIKNWLKNRYTWLLNLLQLLVLCLNYI